MFKSFAIWKQNDRNNIQKLYYLKKENDLNFFQFEEKRPK